MLCIRNVFQNYTINGNTLNNHDMEFILNGTSKEYDLQGIYSAKGFIGSITSLQYVYLAIYDTNIPPFTCTGTEHIDITCNQISLTCPIKMNDETVMHPRNYDGAVFDMFSGADSFVFRQNSSHGGQPIAQFHSPTKACTF